jgi:4-hydroxybenzoate polyprenyltransferase
MALLRSVGTTLEMIKWEHSIFALPFALTGAVLAAGGWPEWLKIFWIVVCMVTARSAAMASIAGLMPAWTQPIPEPRRVQFPLAC